MVPRLEDDLGFLIVRAHLSMRRWLMARVEPLGITYEQFRALVGLWEEDDVSQVSLAERLNVDKTSLARTLKKMEKAELIRRVADENDGRMNRVTLTAKGHDLESKVAPLREEGLAKAVQGLSEGEARDLKRFLKQVYHNMSH